MATKNFYKQLENSLILYDYLINKVGSNKEKFENEILPILNQFETQDFIKSQQNTKYYDYLIDLGLSIDPKYDKAIVEYTLKIRQSPQRKNLSLKYYQYLSLLFTEIYLDLLNESKKDLLKDLNKFREKKYTHIPVFTEKDLKKIAYWMATGSGKTIIAHYNILQIKKHFKHYNKIILITPNEGLSNQHFEELAKSGFNALVYDGNKETLTKDYEILVIDINKIRLEKEKISKDDKGKTIFAEEFGNNNIILVDEGHKGKKQEEGTWEKRREKLSEKGFIFEYSATFGQVANKDNIHIFSKSIIFNYSYKRFYQDGYGKDFKIFNIEGKSKFSEEDKIIILTANLLSFYQQLKAYEDNKHQAYIYNIEKPLWAVLGSKVIGKSTSKEIEETLSDILFFIKFLTEIAENEDFLKQQIEKIINGKTGFKDKYGKDIFQEHFVLLKNPDIDQIAQEIYQKIFLGKGKIELYHIKNSDGEIGLKIKDKYFAVLNVGNIETVKKKIKEKLNVDIKTDEFSPSLFPQAKDPHSTINIVIGAKKFIEGWDSWRVSSMGLIHIGKSEGSQIIQLFGRCVRLKGKNFSLKREPEEIRQEKKWLDILQTAFIFAIGADYLKIFLDIINKEIPQFKELEIDTILNNPENWEKKLIVFENQEEKEENQIINIYYDSKIAKKVRINLIPKIHQLEGGKEKELSNRYYNLAKQIVFLEEFINYNEIYNQLIYNKLLMFKYNISFDIDLIKKIVSKGEYILLSNKLFEVKTLEDLEKLNKIIVDIVEEYINKFYANQDKKQRKKKLQPTLIDKNHPNIIKTIKVKIPYELYEKNKNEIQKIQESLKLKENNEFIPFLFIQPHLYNPITVLKSNQDQIKTIPAKLNEGEKRFIEELEEFLKQNKNKKVYLVRNLPKIGVGFYDEEGYYPDFILWYIKGNTQHIAFIDPKGLRFLDSRWEENFKLKFNVVKTKIYEKLINKQLKEKGIKTKVKLYGFFISTSKDVKIYSNMGKPFDKKQLQDLGIYFFDSYQEKNEELPLISISQQNRYIKDIFERMDIGNELDEYLNLLVENFDLEKEYSLKEILEKLKNIIDEDLYTKFSLYLQLFNKLNIKVNLEDLMVNFTYFYLEHKYLDNLFTEEKKEEIKEQLKAVGIEEEKIEPLITEIYALNPFMIYVFLLYLNSILINLGTATFEKLMQFIENLKIGKIEEDEYTTPDITLTQDTSER